jgi:hypothetical protein
MPADCLIIEGKKFKWNGVEFPSKETILDAIQKYKKDGFEVETCEENEKIFLYTRKVVKDLTQISPV